MNTSLSQMPAGWIDGMSDHDGGGVELRGWLLHPAAGPYDRLDVIWNGTPIGSALPMARPDLADDIYWLADVAKAGFRLRLPSDAQRGRLELLCERAGRPRGRFAHELWISSLEAAALPPAELTERVSSMSGVAFRLSGQKAATDLHDAIASHHTGAAPRILDWGCGCGRVIRYLSASFPSSIVGCDIDRDAVAWCTANLPGTFAVCKRDPPLPYEPNSFDIVLASSVFTHINRSAQLRWLEELTRILHPGGLLIASVMGEYAALLGKPAGRLRKAAPGSALAIASATRRFLDLQRLGISDTHLDPVLDSVAPAGYYRAVDQARRYTMRAWGQKLEIVDYIARGLNGHQDLIVMKRRGRER